MAYTGVQMLMANLKHLVDGNNNPLFHDASVLSNRRQFRRLHKELDSIIQTLFIHEQHHQPEPQEVRDLKRRFKDAAKEAEDIIDLFLSAVHIRNRGIITRSDVVSKTFLNQCRDLFPFSVRFRPRSGYVFEASLNLDDVMRSIKSIKVECMNLQNLNKLMKMDSDYLKAQSAAGETSATRNPLGTKKPSQEVVVGHEREVEVIRDKLVEDQKQLDVVSIVGMGGLGKTTIAAKVFDDRFIAYHFHVRGWVTLSQTYEKSHLLIQILDSMSVKVDLEKDNYSILREKLHKHLMGKRYLIVIDDIWSNEAWATLKIFFPCHNTGSRILLTSRINEVALHAKPHGFIHHLPYLTPEQSLELLCKKVFHNDECLEWLIEPGMQIATKCQGLPLSLVLMAGVLAKEPTNKVLWEKVACGVSSYITSEHKGYLETLALSYHHLPHHLKECFLYLGGFPEDFKIPVKLLMWLWVAEGFIEEAGNQNLEDTAKAYLMDLIDRNLLMVAETTFDGDVKTCKLHDLVRELCQEKTKEERLFVMIDQPLFPQLSGVITPYEQHRVFTNQGIEIRNFPHVPTPFIRSFLGFRWHIPFNYQATEFFRFFALVRVLDLHWCTWIDFPEELALLVHLRYLAIRLLSNFPSAICKLWSLQTLIIITSQECVDLPGNISDLVNLRHLRSNKLFHLHSIDKPMNLHSVSNLLLGDRVDSFHKCFPGIKKFACTSYHTVNDFELLPYLESLNLASRMSLPTSVRYPATLKKLTFGQCNLPWSHMSVIQSLPNLEVLRLKSGSFEGPLWNIGEGQFQRLKFLRLEYLRIKQWEVCSIHFPCLKRLQVKYCDNLEEMPLEIGDISTLELLEVDSWRSLSIFRSLQTILADQHAEGNYELKIKFNGEDLASLVQEHDQDYLTDRSKRFFWTTRADNWRIHSNPQA